ncbi:MAG: ATP-binding protein [bacterium]|nr:ATP-binding protein [bacterium]
MTQKAKKEDFSFEISLSVLNHLGRNLYRSFTTVLGEAISNAWDADATEGHIHINKTKNSFLIKDTGDGMTADEFQNKFLKIGYSKRKISETSPGGRPYIGRKGIGKLALLSCAEKITVISKKKGQSYIGGLIDNGELDNAIDEDLTPQEYLLGRWKLETFGDLTVKHTKGTIIHFKNIHDGIRNSLEFLKKIVALYFRFSLIDNNFKIFINKEKITHECLDDLAEKTQFLWEIDDIEDPYIARLKKKFTLKESKKISVKGGIKGFIASVEKPRDLNIFGTGEKVSVDLFVNGRLRERDILRHIPTARVAESYLYGQIHYNALDDKQMDRFTSSREGIIADDPKYQEFLNYLRDKIISKILADWDPWRRKHREDGDSEDTSISRKDRKAGELYNAVSAEYGLPKDSKNRKKIDGWVDDLADDATYNFSSYAECFISENLIRRFIQEEKVELSKEATSKYKEWEKKEDENKNKGNLSIEIRKNNTKLSYLAMDDLANLVDAKKDLKKASLARDAAEYKPIRDALAHTALLTDKAKARLTAVYSNIKDRLKTLLANSK